VEWAIAPHGMYESALILILILISKQKNLYIVGYVQCDLGERAIASHGMYESFFLIVIACAITTYASHSVYYVC
jgi:hypothetical protein